MPFSANPLYTTIAKMSTAAKNLQIKDDLTSSLSTQEANQFLFEADSIINAKLSQLYYTPLRQITRNGFTDYPDDITFIATRIAAGLAVQAVYARIDPQVSEAGKVHFESAMLELDELCKGLQNGKFEISGQDRKARSHFANPCVVPTETDKQ